MHWCFHKIAIRSATNRADLLTMNFPTKAPPALPEIKTFKAMGVNGVDSDNCITRQ